MNIAIRGIIIKLSITGLIMLLSAGTCLAGAWTLQKGKVYERAGVNYYFAEDGFDKDGEQRDFAANGEFRDLNLSNYIEYGLSDRFTLVNSLYYKAIKKEDNHKESETYGVGDIDLGLKCKLHEGSWGIVSTQALVKIPGPYDKNKELPLGNGQFDVEWRFLYGRSLYPYIPGYCNFELGYRRRFEEPSDEVRYLAEFGIDFSKTFYGRIKLDGIYGMKNGRRDHFDALGNPTTTNNFDLGKLDMTFGCKITKTFGLEVSYIPEMYGKNTAAGATYTFALTYQLL